MTRRLELDAIRGLMLVWMTLTHLPTMVSVAANQPFGFVSGAEGFIFLSALLCGLVSIRLAQRRGYAEMRASLYRRAVRLYGHHVLLLACAFVVIGSLAVYGTADRPSLYNLLAFYLTDTTQAVAGAALLLYRPPLLDILPMYIVFLAITPLVLTLASRVGWTVVLGGSAALWLGAQCGLRAAIHGALVAYAGLRVPLNEMGAFDLWAWQLQWVAGLYVGMRWATHDLPVAVWARRLTIPALCVVPVLWVMRYAVGNGIELGVFEFAFNKWHLGAVRLINFAAFAILLVRFPSIVRALAVRPLVMLGQASLQVFCVHLFFCFLGLAMVGEGVRVTGWSQAVLLVATLGGMWWTARLFARDAHALTPRVSVLDAGPRLSPQGHG